MILPHQHRTYLELVNLALLVIFEVVHVLLQPLDVGVFGPLKKEWNKRVDAYLTRTGETLPIKEVVREYMEARRVAFKATTIKHAFYKSGIKENEDFDSCFIVVMGFTPTMHPAM